MFNAFENIDENITLVRGDTLAFGIELEQANENDISITAPLDQDLDSCAFTVRKDYNNGDIVFQKTLGDGIEQEDTNKYRVRIAPEDTANLEPGIYYYDCKIGLNNDVFTILRGCLGLAPDATNE